MLVGARLSGPAVYAGGMDAPLATPGLPLSSRPLWALSWLIWRIIPGRAAAKMAEFSHTEAGSGLDMLAAAEETPRPELRARYFRHALDELRHSRMFRDRARALAGARGRAEAVLEDGGWIADHGIRGQKSLLEELGETEFLAFVWIHERRGAEQFQVYAELLRDDPITARMFEEIARDERFHIAYSRAELDRLAERGAETQVRAAVRAVRWRRAKQAWLRFSRVLGDTMAQVWLGLLYFVVVGPFVPIARWTERPTRGFQTPEGPALPAAERAQEMG